MIKRSELRDGNILKGQHGYIVYDSMNDTIRVAVEDYCCGMKITPKRLVSLGFEYYVTDKSDNYKLGHFRISFVVDGRFKGKTFITFANSITVQDFKYCQYVHQLQNLYFALTGEELLFNPDKI